MTNKQLLDLVDMQLHRAAFQLDVSEPRDKVIGILQSTYPLMTELQQRRCQGKLFEVEALAF